MNSDQVEIVLQYLKIETNYAIIINGQYGVGKTYFFKNTLIPKIKELSDREHIDFTPIHISLFGKKSLEEIQSAIFIELFPILKDKNLKLAAGIGKILLRGITQIIQAGDIDKYINDLKKSKKALLNFDKIVICFDDLDRKSELLDITEIFGFINSLVEDQGAKILIIANEEQLLKDIKYTSILREKVIGVSIQFKPELEIVYNQIIKSRYESSDKMYFDFLFTNSHDIINIIQLNQNNFRNLIFFLEHFKIIFYSIESKFQTDNDFRIYKSEKLKAILNFTLAITIEYKIGLLNSTNLEDIKAINDNTLENFDFDAALFETLNSKNQTSESEPTYIEVFKNKYFSRNKFYYFNSIFEYIIGIRAFIIDNLVNELENYFIIKDGKILESDQILNKLDYINYLKLSDQDYRDLTKKMLVFVDKGAYNLNQYATAFHFATRFNNLLNFNITNLKERFKKGILKGKANYTYTFNLRYFLTTSQDTEFSEDVKEIIKFCQELNDSIKITNNKDFLETLFDIFLTDFDAFIDKVSKNDLEFKFEPFWLRFNMKKIITRINKLEKDQIVKLGYYFEDRYRREIPEKLYPEKDFIIRLRTIIDNPTHKRQIKNLRNISLDTLSHSLKLSESNFPT